MRHKRSIAVLVSLGFLVLAAAAVEFSLRLFSPLYLAGIQKAYHYDPDVGYRLKPGIHMLQLTDHQEEVRVNSLGTVNFQESFAPYSVLVFALGDSYTQGTGLPADASYPFQLDLILNSDARGLYSPRYAVVNLGVAAFGGEQSLITLRRYKELLGKPSIVLYLGSENDYQDDLLFRGGYRHKSLVDGNPNWNRALPLLQWAAQTEIGKRMKLAISARRQGRLAPPAAGPAGLQAEPSVAELERPALENLVRICRQEGALLVVSWSTAPSASYRWLQSWAGDAGIAFADWLPAVQSVQQAIPAIPVDNPHSGRHLRAWVLRMIAEQFAQQIRERQPQ